MARYGPGSDDIERLLADTRVLGPSGIERIAWAWKRYSNPQLGECDEAEATARGAIAEHGLEEAWQAAEADLREMTEGHHAQSSWRAEAPAVGRTAEDAALHAALALVVRPHLPVDVYRTLVKTASEALPWLLPSERPDQYRERRH
jgi:hypothetical protein